MIDAPSPDTYTLDPTFGKKGIKYSMSSKLDRSGLKVDDRHKYYLKLQEKLPGPGHYNHVALVGTVPVISKYTMSKVNKFSKSNDRFITAN